MRKYGNNIFNVRLNSMQDIVNFYKFIYKDSNVYLSRKKGIFDSVMLEINLEIY